MRLINLGSIGSSSTSSSGSGSLSDNNIVTLGVSAPTVVSYNDATNTVTYSDGSVVQLGGQVANELQTHGNIVSYNDATNTVTYADGSTSTGTGAVANQLTTGSTGSTTASGGAMVTQTGSMPNFNNLINSFFGGSGAPKAPGSVSASPLATAMQASQISSALTQIVPIALIGIAAFVLLKKR